VSFALLAEQPEIGAALTLRAPQLAGLRPGRRVHRARDACRAGLVGAAWNHLEAAWGRPANHGILSRRIYTNQVPISA
jgi:hypothetical protein